MDAMVISMQSASATLPPASKIAFFVRRHEETSSFFEILGFLCCTAASTELRHVG